MYLGEDLFLSTSVTNKKERRKSKTMEYNPLQFTINYFVLLGGSVTETCNCWKKAQGYTHLSNHQKLKLV